MGTSIGLGKLFGIQFRLHFSWFIIFALVTFSLVYPDYSQWFHWVIGVVTSLLFFASVIAHELAHSLVGRNEGIPIDSITLFIFGGVARMTKEVTNPEYWYRHTCETVQFSAGVKELLAENSANTVFLEIGYIGNNGCIIFYQLK